MSDENVAAEAEEAFGDEANAVTEEFAVLVRWPASGVGIAEERVPATSAGDLLGDIGDSGVLEIARVDGTRVLLCVGKDDPVFIEVFPQAVWERRKVAEERQRRKAATQAVVPVPGLPPGFSQR